MNDVSRFLAQLFTERPYVFISWPATAMVVGTIAVKCSQGIATRLGLQPRTGRGLVGIFTAPFLHANFAHLAANLPPFVVLGWLVLRHGEKPFLYATLMIALAQGVLLWLLGRRAAHIGMSGVIFGFLGWLVTMAWLTRATADLLAAAGVLIFYGGMLAGVAPARNGTSWEGHLFGLLAGVGTAWWMVRG